MNIVVGVTGGIAAYKSVALVRLLTQHHRVRVVMSDNAHAFIGKMSFLALCDGVHDTLMNEDAERAMGHIELARWADLVVIAPCTANTMARLAHGLCDDLLSTLIHATRAPVWLFCAMNVQMWQHPATQKNAQILTELGYHIGVPDSGVQACGDVGLGRMREPEQILNTINDFLAHAQNTPPNDMIKTAPNLTMPKQGSDDDKQTALTDKSSAHAPQPDNTPILNTDIFADKTLIITAGATIEPIDPVRYLSNHSSGKMGFALANAAAGVFKQVIIIGQKSTLWLDPRVRHVQTTSAKSMLDACQGAIIDPKSTVFIGAAAVADYTLDAVPQKIKKSADTLVLYLHKTVDILANMAQMGLYLVVGFAAETHNALDYATDKLVKKNLDMIALNDVLRDDIGFGSDDNAMTLLFAPKFNLAPAELNKAPKSVIAQKILQHMADLACQITGKS